MNYFQLLRCINCKLGTDVFLVFGEKNCQTLLGAIIYSLWKYKFQKEKNCRKFEVIILDIQGKDNI